MRGKQEVAKYGAAVAGITPADAGKTAYTLDGGYDVQDHPRGCGENNTISPAMQVKLGSPPRMRGKPLCGFRVQAAARITPADAGKTDAVLQ